MGTPHHASAALAAIPPGPVQEVILGSVRAHGWRVRAGRLQPRSGLRPQGHHRHPLDRPRPGARRHPLLPVRLRGGRPRRRPPAGQGHELQGGRGRAQPRRRQGGHHRRPQAGQVRGSAARLRPLRRGPRRPLHHRRGRRDLHPRHGRGRAGDPVRHRPLARQRRRRRPLDQHRLRGAEGHAGGGRGAVERARPGRPPRRRPGCRQGRHPPLPSAPPGRGPDHRGRRGRRQRGHGRSRSSAPTPSSRARPTRSRATSSPRAPWGRSSTTTPCPS